MSLGNDGISPGCDPVEALGEVVPSSSAASSKRRTGDTRPTHQTSRSAPAKMPNPQRTCFVISVTPFSDTNSTITNHQSAIWRKGRLVSAGNDLRMTMRPSSWRLPEGRGLLAGLYSLGRHGASCLGGSKCCLAAHGGPTQNSPGRNWPHTDSMIAVDAIGGDSLTFAPWLAALASIFTPR